MGKTYPNLNYWLYNKNPNSIPPSIADFNSCFPHNYEAYFVICHNGIIYSYTSNQEISLGLYELYLQEFIDYGNNETEAQIKALITLKKNHKIDFQEVM